MYLNHRFISTIQFIIIECVAVLIKFLMIYNLDSSLIFFVIMISFLLNIQLPSYSLYLFLIFSLSLSILFSLYPYLFFFSFFNLSCSFFSFFPFSLSIPSNFPKLQDLLAITDNQTKHSNTNAWKFFIHRCEKFLIKKIVNKNY